MNGQGNKINKNRAIADERAKKDRMIRKDIFDISQRQNASQKKAGSLWRIYQQTRQTQVVAGSLSCFIDQ
jgi:hypothetical protein